MLFAAKSDLLELQNSLTTLENTVKRLQDSVKSIQDGWEAELLKLGNAKELMARASARLERAADRQQPTVEPVDEPTNGDAPSDPSQLTNPLARMMLGLKGE